jgi:tellurite resistance protein TehA-like permease
VRVHLRLFQKAGLHAAALFMLILSMSFHVAHSCHLHKHIVNCSLASILVAHHAVKWTRYQHQQPLKHVWQLRHASCKSAAMSLRGNMHVM